MLAEGLFDPFEELFPLAFHFFGDVARDGREMAFDAPLLAVRAAKEGDRRAPAALPGDRPLEPVVHHGADPVLAVGGDPRDAVVDLAERPVAEGGEVDEPLVRRPEDDGVLAAPAVRVTVGSLRLREELRARGVAGLERGENGRAGIVGRDPRGDDAPAPQGLRGVEVVVARLVDGAERRVVHLEAGSPHDLVVVAPVPRSGVNEARAVRRRDVLANEEAEVHTVEVEGTAVSESSGELRNRCGGTRRPFRPTPVSPAERLGDGIARAARRREADWSGSRKDFSR